MVDTEVENVLREIRERVRAGGQSQAHQSIEMGQHQRHEQDERDTQNERASDAILSRLEAHLATTNRAWDKLPPLTSRRSGLFARLELWLKRLMRRGTHWYAWEQINFNAAVNEALHDIARALSTYERETANTLDHFTALSQLRTQFESRLAALESGFAAFEDKLVSLSPSEAAHTPEQVRELSAELAGLRRELDERLSQIRDEQRAHIAHLQDQQRVSFKQLALEINETAIDGERSRRLAQSQFDELAARVEELKKMKTSHLL